MAIVKIHGALEAKVINTATLGELINELGFDESKSYSINGVPVSDPATRLSENTLVIVTKKIAGA